MHGRLIKIKKEKVPHEESRMIAHGVGGSAKSLIRKDSTEREGRVHIS